MLVFSPIKLTHNLVDTIYKLFFSKYMIVSGHNSYGVGALICLGTNMSRHSHACAQPCGHNHVWAQNLSGHKRVWAQNVSGHSHVVTVVAISHTLRTF